MVKTLGSALALFALALAGPSWAGGGAQATAKAHVAGGELVGVLDGETASFDDIPFAAPPLGPLRWAPPQPAPAWKGVRDATAFGPACPQPINKDGRINGGGYFGPISEAAVRHRLHAVWIE